MSDRRFPTSVAIRDRASGRFLAVGAAWTSDEDGALVLGVEEAAEAVRRLACEAEALELVAAATDRLAVA